MPRRVLALLVAACLVTAAVLTRENAARAERAAAASPAPRVARPAAPATACRLASRYRDAFARAARATRLPVAMLVAVGEVESRLNQNARSPAGAEGVLQVLPATATALGLDSSRPSDNVLAGAVYLRQLLERFGSVDLALAAYNAGPSAVEHAAGAPSAETLTYVANVTARWRVLLRCR